MTAPSVTDEIVNHLGMQFSFIPTNPELKPSQVSEMEKNVKQAEVNRVKSLKRQKKKIEEPCGVFLKTNVVQRRGSW